MFTFKNYLNLPAALLVAASAMSLTSCDNTIYEDLKPCEVKHAVRFQWTRNMLQTDAFSNFVRSVCVYVFDSNDRYVTKFSEAGDRLSMQGYTLPIEGLEPGEYTFVAWCGLENEGTRAESFTVDGLKPGVTTRQEMLCTMRREIHDDGTHHSSEELYDLYHGTAYGVTIYPAESGSMLGDHVYTISLTKDTNSMAVSLININGEPLDINKYSFVIEENNGTLKPDNSVDEDDEMINYHEYDKYQAAGEVESRGFYVSDITRASAPSAMGGGILKLSRLMEDQHCNLSIINNETNEVVYRCTMIDFALRGKVADVQGRFMTDQEYLDSQDKYSLDLHLQNGSWANVSVSINGWTIYESNPELN
ncbi:MAG: FimB/Mfa2 family fimbrial subunit [Muribaculaceae bacterium]|nr:FimB/Mfa2 family fimbrial subunit [Muribaculaceae bacterium]